MAPLVAPLVASNPSTLEQLGAFTRAREERQTAGMQLNASNPVLAVHDLARSSEWYERVLGCESAEIDGGGWVFCRQGEVTFMLGVCPDAMPAADIGDHSYLAYLRVDDVDAFHARARDAGAEILKAPVDEPWGMREMALRSPDGHRFMLGEAARGPKT